MNKLLLISQMVVCEVESLYLFAEGGKDGGMGCC